MSNEKNAVNRNFKEIFFILKISNSIEVFLKVLLIFVIYLIKKLNNWNHQNYETLKIKEDSYLRFQL